MVLLEGISQKQLSLVEPGPIPTQYTRSPNKKHDARTLARNSAASALAWKARQRNGLGVAYTGQDLHSFS